MWDGGVGFNRPPSERSSYSSYSKTDTDPSKPPSAPHTPTTTCPWAPRTSGPPYSGPVVPPSGGPAHTCRTRSSHCSGGCGGCGCGISGADGDRGARRGRGRRRLLCRMLRLLLGCVLGFLSRRCVFLFSSSYIYLSLFPGLVYL